LYPIELCSLARVIASSSKENRYVKTLLIRSALFIQ